MRPDPEAKREARERAEAEFARLAMRIRMVVLDVDGVLTDGSIILDNEGNEIKSFHVRDGHGVKLAIRAGILIAIITGRASGVVERRMRELGIKEVHQGVHDKLSVYLGLLASHGLSDEEAAFMGDDVVDLSVLSRVGLPCAPRDADGSVRKAARFVSRHRGGRGAVRDLLERILKAQGKWEDLIGLPRP